MHFIIVQICEDKEVKIPKISCEESEEKAVEEHALWGEEGENGEILFV